MDRRPMLGSGQVDQESRPVRRRTFSRSERESRNAWTRSSTCLLPLRRRNVIVKPINDIVSQNPRWYHVAMASRGPYAKGLAKREEIGCRLDEFARRGYDRTSMREIARQTGLSQAGLLHYFSTKEELFLAVLRRRDDRATGPGGSATCTP